ncbi:MAG: hypothetical protein JKX92_05850 [Porticoccaceae bacterium]|nr:hypothetical protein [Porticoccaceae bacterium]
MNPILKYQCNQCGDLHDDTCEAIGCCPQISEAHTCGHCGEHFGHDEGAAESCCDDVDPDALPITSHAELEAAGQLRLYS